MKDVEKQEFYLDHIRTATKHMSQLLKDLLFIGQAEAGKLEFSPIPLEMVEFCRNVIAEMTLSADTSHTIRLVSQCDRLDGYWDDKLLRQILINLLSNAVKYSPQGGLITIELLNHNEELTLNIQDCGIGIPLDDQQQLFEPFQRASNVGSIDGTGLGLAIVKRCVDLSQGTIAVASTIGTGTCFSVTLPLRS